MYTQTHKLQHYAKNLIGMPGLAILYQLTHYVGTFWRISRTEPQFGSFQRYIGILVPTFGTAAVT